LHYFAGRNGNSPARHPLRSWRRHSGAPALNLGFIFDRINGTPDNPWSPDGSQIAFVSNRDGNSEIYVMNSDGTGLTRLTDNPDDDVNPRWSPDGSMIAFWTNRNGDSEIYVMNADGTGQVNVTRDARLDEEHAWGR
jgi:Tol biopolymer transport system component